MKNKKFLLKVRRDLAPEPEDFSIRKFSCFDFFTSTSSFIEYNFSGAMNIEFPKTCSGYVHISPRGFAAFIRLLLSEIYGSTMTTARVYANEKEVVISISGSGLIKSRAKLINLAERSGFSFVEEENTIILRTPLTLAGELYVFSVGNLELINYYYEAFLHE